MQIQKSVSPIASGAAVKKTLSCKKMRSDSWGPEVFHSISFWQCAQYTALQLKYTYLHTYVHKVHIFWEGHKILRNLHRRFDRYYIGQTYGGDFAKICGLLRISELYQKHPNIHHNFFSRSAQLAIYLEYFKNSSHWVSVVRDSRQQLPCNFLKNKVLS